MSIASLIRPPPLWVPSPVGGPSPYVAQAVHFDGSVWLETSGLIGSISGTPYLSGSFWVKMSQIEIDDQRNIIGYNSGLHQIYMTVTGTSKISISVVDLFHSQSLSMSSTTVLSPDVWVNVRFDTDMGAGTGHIYFGLNDVTGAVTADTGTFVSDGLEIGFPDTTSGGYPSIGDFADFFLALGTAIDMSVGADGALFYAAGKPGDPADFPASLVFFSGDSSTFPINQGTGGAFTLTGSLTNASSSPSD